jgi:long-chain acyl-CoA synthetase
MAILPFFHAYGGTLCLFLALRCAARVVLVPRFEVKDVMELIEEYSPSILPGVPTLYNALIRAADNNPARQAALRSIRICVSGGAPLAPEIIRRFESITGGHTVEGYGLSEASPVTHVNPLDGRARDGSIGLPLPSTDARLVDLDTGEPAATGEPGELLIRGPQVMRGYWKRPDDTAAVLDSAGWLHTGDIATMDEDGFFYIVDRLKDVIITGGENVYPREIEDVLMEHPKIQEVAVAGVPHDVGGEVAKAYIVLRDGETMDRREVIRYCAEKLARYKVPRQVEFRAELPKSAAGKILRRELETPPSAG